MCVVMSAGDLSFTKTIWTEGEDRAVLTLPTSCLKTFGTATFKQSGRIFLNKSSMWQLHFLYRAGKRITVFTAETGRLILTWKICQIS